MLASVARHLAHGLSRGLPHLAPIGHTRSSRSAPIKVRSRCLVCLLPPATPRADLLLLPSPAASLHLHSMSLQMMHHPHPPQHTRRLVLGTGLDVRRLSPTQPLALLPILETATDSRDLSRRIAVRNSRCPPAHRRKPSHAKQVDEHHRVPRNPSQWEKGTLPVSPMT